MHRLRYLVIILMFLISGCSRNSMSEQSKTIKSNMGNKFNIFLILGSTREGRTSEKIGKALKAIADKRSDLDKINVEIIDLKDYNLPFLYDQEAPINRKIINDPKIKKWSEKIDSGNSFVIITPEYNAGYPGVLKNSLDIIYKEWNDKPVALVGYSGGPSGGLNATSQLKQVVKKFKMKPVESEIHIPMAWKAFDENQNFLNKEIENQFDKMIDELIKNEANKSENTNKI